MDVRVCCGAPKSQEELLCAQGPGVRPGLGWVVRVGAGTYPVQRDVGDLETQNDDPDESQDEGLVSVHDVLWPNERYWHLQAQLAGFNCEAHVPEKTGYPKVGGPAARWEGLGIHPVPGGPQGRKRQGTMPHR